ncbi:MAG: hypothetical protein E7662_04980 [Ruminococcaceae bacterium]|nr:hypothetical protein [Oscillospiraceae bacterium]
MKSESHKILSFLLCIFMLLGVFPDANPYEHMHFETEHTHHDHDDHSEHDETAEEISILSVCEDAVGFVLSLISMPVSAAYEDGVECDYCGGWRYDDWKCDNGNHCGEGADGSCYEEHHCGYCGACEEDNELCDDCGNCLEDHCECDEKCRGCYSTSGDVCDVCNEHCTECVDFICDDCGICAECAGNELYCAECMLCIGCADWICYCGEGCSNCTIGCPECHEYCYNCSEDELCKDCGICFSCVGGDGNFCGTCLLCKNCTEYLCACGQGCTECAYLCEQCGEKCENCADEEICDECGTCKECVGGDGNFCDTCNICKHCVDYICVSCGGGCSECAIICPECGEKCENCADDELCGDCEVCFTCRGGEGNYCEECGLCKFCVEFVCLNGDGCSQCAYVCPDCGEKCSNCAELEMCIECNVCFDCVGGEGNYCSECLLCKNCVEQVCYCGNGCSNCSVICMACGEKCENCADDQLCSECERCFECVDGTYCAECGECSECVEVLCACGNGCNQCAEVICEECNEKCSNCAPEELCTECGTCRECVGGEDDFCDNCSICKFCVEYICVGCGQGCSNCVEVICEECGEKCSNCANDELCLDCGICRDCAGGEGHFCDSCQLCKNCTEIVCYCGGGCAGCAVVCMECGEKCSNCSESEICVECGKCVDCAGADSFCITCGLCADCGTVCPCGEGCENCADLCPDCGEKCSNCCDEFCASCDICRECADDMYCEDCGLCGECTEVCEDCGIVCRDCAESVCEECGKCSGCIDEFCPDCGICGDCADAMCQDCHYCGECAEAICDECGEFCSDCAGFCAECKKCENCAEICPDCELCKDCCADKAEEFGCKHKICPESAEWLKHYCTVGSHCTGTKTKTAHNETEHWTLCGEGCDIKLNVQAHIFDESKVKKEATQKADGVMKLTCTECGFSKEETIPKLTGGHTHAYTTTVTAPSCSAGGYTTHTCSCGHSWTEGETAPVMHDYQHKHTAAEHWLECIFCHETKDKAVHRLGEWKTVLKAGYTFAGEKQRACKICGYAVSESIPVLTIPENKFVVTIPEYPVIGDTSTDNADSGTDQKPQENTPVQETTAESAGSSPAVPPVTGTPDKPAEQTPAVSKPSTTTVKELLTKGTDNTVPALPTLSRKEEGNIFEGWVDKATGTPVAKGDKLTGNIEIEPVWKDCGENNHADKNDNGACDECGYILEPQKQPDDPVPAETQAPAETPPTENSGIPLWVIIILSLSFGIMAICGCILIITAKKRR